MLVKCVDLNGEKRDREHCYKAPNGKYYSSEEAYLRIKEENDWRKKYIELLQSILKHDEHQKIPTLFLGKIKNTLSTYPAEAIYRTLEKEQKYLEWKIWDGSFKGESHQINYIIKVIEGNINDVYAGMMIEKKRNAIQTDNEVQEGLFDLEGHKNTSTNVATLVED